MQTYKEKHKSKMLENRADKLLKKSEISKQIKLTYQKKVQMLPQEYFDSKLPDFQFSYNPKKNKKAKNSSVLASGISVKS